MSVAERFGRNLAHTRKRAGISQEETAVRASLHRTAVGQLERAERVARVDTLIKLAGALGVEPGELLEGLKWEPGETRLGEFRLEETNAEPDALHFPDAAMGVRRADQLDRERESRRDT